MHSTRIPALVFIVVATLMAYGYALDYIANHLLAIFQNSGTVDHLAHCTMLIQFLLPVIVIIAPLSRDVAATNATIVIKETELPGSLHVSNETNQNTSAREARRISNDASDNTVHLVQLKRLSYIKPQFHSFRKRPQSHVAPPGIPARMSQISPTAGFSKQCAVKGTSGFCVVNANVTAECWDKEIEESEDCDKDEEVCCWAPQLPTVDEAPCGTTGPVFRSPRRWRPPVEKAASDICWMALLVAVKTNGERIHLCDAVITDASHLMTASECMIRIKDMGTGVKRLYAMVGQPNLSRRMTPMNAPEQCGQQYNVDHHANLSDSTLALLARRGYALVRVHGQIMQDRCTCRVCLPRAEDFTALSVSAQCYITDFVKTKGKKVKGGNFDLWTLPTRLLPQTSCNALLKPQHLPDSQLTEITERLLCSLANNAVGECYGGMGGSLTCVRDFDQRHILIGLSIQPVDCYSAPRLFRNVVGCYGRIQQDDGCIQPPIQTAHRSCGRSRGNRTDSFGLGFQTASGSTLRHLSIGRRMQMLSSFPVSDVVLLGRSGFSQSEIANPGLHLVQEPVVCWEVGVFNPDKGHCSGVLLTNRFVMTAAHCVTHSNGTIFDNSVVERMRIFVGFDSIPRMKRRDCEDVIAIKSIRVHPMFTKPSGKRFYDLNDIALIELSDPVDVDNNPCVCTICLSNTREPVPGELCTFSGYGCSAPILASETCPAPRPWPLAWTNVIVLSDKACGVIPEYPANMMSCSVTDGGPAGCYGDSGGPLVCYDPQQERHYLHAIFSFLLSVNQAAPQRCRMLPLNPNYYTKVSSFLPWLIENVPDLEIH